MKLPISRRSRSILEEINSFVPVKDKDEFIESKAQHIISSAINLLETIDKSYNQEEALVLKKRFFSSIKNSDPDRFSRIIEKIKNNDFSNNIDE